MLFSFVKKVTVIVNFFHKYIEQVYKQTGNLLKIYRAAFTPTLLFAKWGNSFITKYTIFIHVLCIDILFFIHFIL